MSEHDKNKIVPFYAMKLRDAVRPLARIVVTCWGCKRVTAPDLPELIGKFGPNTTLRDLERRTFRCTSCGGTSNSFSGRMDRVTCRNRPQRSGPTNQPQLSAACSMGMPQMLARECPFRVHRWTSAAVGFPAGRQA